MKLIYAGNARFPSDKAHPFQILQMCEAFSRKGVEVELVYPFRKNPLSAEDILEYYGIEENIRMTRLYSVDVINRFPVKWQKLPFLFQGATFSLRLLSYLFRTTADVVYTRDAFSILPLFQTRSPSGRKNVFLEIHKLPASRPGRGIVFQVARKAGGVVTVTSHLKEQMVKEGIDRKAVLVAHDGVDLKRFSSVREDREALRKKLGLPRKCFLAGYVGRFIALDMEKGLGDMIRALAIIRKEAADVEMCFVGGPLDQVGAYREIAASQGLDPSLLHFFDHVEPGLVPAFQKALDVCMIPTPWTHHYAYNVSPMKLFEYMASGNPIVATSLPSAKEVLAHGKNALLTEPENPADLAAAVLRLRKDAQFASGLASQAYRDVQCYTWEERAKHILDFFAARKGNGGIRV